MALIVLLAAALAARWALSVEQWRVMTDELTYWKVGQSMADTLSPAPTVRGVSSGNYGLLYPGLLAPLLGLFGLPTAFGIAHGIGAVLMASTGIPAYLLTRYVSGSRVAGVVAAAPVATVPWVLLSLNLFTEVLAYPLFVWSAYAVVMAIAQPARRRDLAALGALVLLVLARTQFIFLFALFPAAVVLHEIALEGLGRDPRRWLVRIGRGIRSAVTGHLVLIGALAVGLLAYASSAVLPLGSYQAVVDGSTPFAPGFARSALEHLNQIALGIAVLPLVLVVAFVAEALWRPADRGAHALALWSLLCVPAVIAVGTDFDLRIATGVQQRYVFYVAPLLLIAAACYPVLARRPAVAVGVGALLTAASLHLSAFQPAPETAAYASPARVPYVALDYRVGQVAGWVGGADLGNGTAWGIAACLGALLMVVLLRAGRRMGVLVGLGICVTVWCVALTWYAGPRLRDEHEAFALMGLGVEIPPDRRGWVDAAVPDGANVALVPSAINARGGKAAPLGTITDQSVWWQVEFWNRSVRRGFLFGSAMDYTAYASQPLTLNRRTGRLRAAEGEAPYLVLAKSNVLFGPVGSVLASQGDLELRRAPRPYRAAWATRGLDVNGQFGRAGAALDVYGSPDAGRRRYTASIALSGRTLTRPLSVRSGSAEAQIRVFGRRIPRQTLCVPANGSRRVTLRPGAEHELRVIGVRVRMQGPC